LGPATKNGRATRQKSEASPEVHFEARPSAPDTDAARKFNDSFQLSARVISWPNPQKLSATLFVLLASPIVLRFEPLTQSIIPMSSRPERPNASTQTDDSMVGRTVGKYEITRFIGRGGMGTVYEGVNTSIGKRVAMKFVDAEMAKNTDAVARFQREAQAASAVESAHIVEIFDSGFTDDGLPYIVMELLRGEDLGHRIKRCGRLEIHEALHVTAQILRGLHRAHEAGIIHRDLKPDNIFLVDRDDDVDFAKVLDFGISKMQRAGEVPLKTLTREGTVLGTPFYMAPEQAQALSDIDGRADLWSMGAILYECLSGRPPHSGSTYEQVIINICMKDADDVRVHNPAVPEPIAKVIAKALSRERVDRFSSARELLEALIASSGGLLSPRASRGSSDEVASGERSRGSSGGGLSRTPARGASEAATGFEPTVEVPSGGPSKIGWSTQRRDESARRNRVLAASLGGAAVAVAVSVFFMITGNESGAAAKPQDTAAQAAPVGPVEVEMKLRSSVAGARFSIDGVEAPDGVVKGVKGETKKVRVEADGYAAVLAEVTLDPAMESMEIPLPTRAPDVAPVPEAGEAGATATPAVAVVAPSPGGGAKAALNKGSSKKSPAVKAVQTGAPVPAAAPQATGGVANGLTIKSD
jgi:serine/threonine-protein kinase